MSRACGKCEHFKPVERERGKVSGQCKRYPPVIVDMKSVERMLFLQPSVREDDYCGEFSPILTAKKPPVEHPSPLLTPDELPF